MKKNLLFLMLMASGGYAWAGRSEADLVKLDTSYGKTKDIIFEYNFNSILEKCAKSTDPQAFLQQYAHALFILIFECQKDERNEIKNDHDDYFAKTGHQSSHASFQGHDIHKETTHNFDGSVVKTVRMSYDGHDIKDEIVNDSYSFMEALHQRCEEHVNAHYEFLAEIKKNRLKRDVIMFTRFDLKETDSFVTEFAKEYRMSAKAALKTVQKIAADALTEAEELLAKQEQKEVQEQNKIEFVSDLFFKCMKYVVESLNELQWVLNDDGSGEFKFPENLDN